jgi:diguanylate cyclase (GGDEF)-like protein
MSTDNWQMTQNATLPAAGPEGRTATRVGLALLLGATFSAAVWLQPGPRQVDLAVDDLGQLLAAGVATVAAAIAARRAGGTQRVAWAWIALGTGAWAAGQAVWTAYELLLSREVPFPSAADAGFLLSPVATAVGLLAWLARGRRAAGGIRDVLDGLIIAGSLLVLSWVTALGAVYVAGGPDLLAFTLAMSYPIGDILTATLALLAVARSGGRSRGPLLVLAAGLGALAAADSAYVYLVTVGSYATGNLISSGWVTGFLLITAAAGTAAGQRESDLRADEERPSWLRLAMPYVPLLAAIATIAFRVVVGGEVSRMELGLGTGLVLLVMCRQFLVLADNLRLMTALRQREQELAHQAFHDPLTGLANRTQFVARLAVALARHQRTGAGLAVMFDDLDDFKNVNDQLGHSAGDALLVDVGRRLSRCLRAVDVVARLGGDEFAALLEPPHDDPVAVADRVVATMAPDAVVHGRSVAVGASVGVAYLDPAPYGAAGAAPSAAQIVAAADRAMYRAKGAGKGRAVVEPVALEGVGEAPPGPGPHLMRSAADLRS